MVTIKKVGIISKRGRPEPLEILKDFVPWLKNRGYETILDSETAQSLGMEGYPRPEIPALVDVVIVLGGDGTMLGVARLVDTRGTPILGINLGGLGFITEVNRGDVYEVVAKVLAGECPVEERMMLEARVHRYGEEIEGFRALNDVVINKGALARIVEIETSVDGSYVTSFRADGLIISTPTGSTAYSLSAGGPILHPTLRCIAVTPICPHTLTNRPVVLPDAVTINLVLKSESEAVFLTVDGQVGFPLMKNDTIVVKKSEYTTKLLIPCSRDYFQTIRAKLKWGGRVDQSA